MFLHTSTGTNHFRLRELDIFLGKKKQSSDNTGFSDLWLMAKTVIPVSLWVEFGAVGEKVRSAD